MCGYDGPIYMTHPTRAICPILLEDYRKITVEKKGDSNFFTSEMIKNCMKKVKVVNIHQTIKVDDEIEIRAYYAGHVMILVNFKVLGAAMFYVKVKDETAVYTGDYNMTPDRHLGAAWIDKVKPDVLITETTYATTIRDSKRARERDFLKNVHTCVSEGGKVLIPVFALGRAQELCILIETYWERMKLDVPVYFSAGLTERANDYYKLFISWTNQKIKMTFAERNMFDFKHIKAFDRALIDNPGPMVLFAAPGMLHSGTSLEVFKKWAPNPKNMVILPGYCVANTVGAKILAGIKTIDLDKKTSIQVRLQVKNLSFSAHADAKGILQLIRQCEPRNVVLVHGEKAKMEFLREKIIKEFNIGCFSPPNGQVTEIPCSLSVPVNLDYSLLNSLKKSALSIIPDFENEQEMEKVKKLHMNSLLRTSKLDFHGVLIENGVDFSVIPSIENSLVTIILNTLKTLSLQKLKDLVWTTSTDYKIIQSLEIIDSELVVSRKCFIKQATDTQYHIRWNLKDHECQSIVEFFIMLISQ